MHPPVAVSSVQQRLSDILPVRAASVTLIHLGNLLPQELHIEALGIPVNDYSVWQYRLQVERAAFLKCQISRLSDRDKQSPEVISAGNVPHIRQEDTELVGVLNFWGHSLQFFEHDGKVASSEVRDVDVDMLRVPGCVAEIGRFVLCSSLATDKTERCIVELIVLIQRDLSFITCNKFIDIVA